MNASDIIKAKREDVLRLADRHGAHKVRVFGSVVRGEADLNSDIDLLGEMGQGRSLLDLSELSQELEALLGRKVDILPDESRSPYLKQWVHAEGAPLVKDSWVESLAVHYPRKGVNVKVMSHDMRSKIQKA